MTRIFSNTYYIIASPEKNQKRLDAWWKKNSGQPIKNTLTRAAYLLACLIKDDLSGGLTLYDEKGRARTKRKDGSTWDRWERTGHDDNRAHLYVDLGNGRRRLKTNALVQRFVAIE